MKMSTRYGFTIVELLVVIAIIGVIVGLIFPAVQVAREAGRRTTCTSNLRQIAFAAINYQEVHKAFPPGCIHFTTNEIHLEQAILDHSVDVPCGMIGWPAFLLPFLEAGETTYRDIDFLQPAFADYCGADPHINTYCDELKGKTSNETASRNCPSVLRCPSTPHMSQSMKGMKDYAANGCVDRPERVNDPKIAGNQVAGNRAALMGVFYRNSGIRLTDIKDGSSHTFLFLEQSAMSFPEAAYQTEFGANPFFFVNHGGQGFVVCSIEGNAIPPNPMGLPPTQGPRSFHPLGLHSALGDGSIKFIRDLIAPSIWEATFTRSQGQYTWEANPANPLHFGGGLRTAESQR